MYYGIEVVSKPVHQWGVEELREFIDKNGAFLSELVGNEPDIDDFVKVAEVGKDFERIAGTLATICEDNEAADEIKRLDHEVDDLHSEIDDLKQKNESHEQYIDELEDKIDGLKDTIANLEEQLANREE